MTSDPGDPRFPLDDPINLLARDTDNDAVGDIDEKDFGTNPRLATPMTTAWATMPS